MKVEVFINNYREAFGENTELPVTFWYSDEPIAETEKINGCFFKCFNSLRKGMPISLTLDTLSCMGGKFYTGFKERNERMPAFVSLKEKYKRTPEMVEEFAQRLGVIMTDKRYLNIARVDKIGSFEGKEGVIFFATPYMLAGLATWTFFDNNSDDAVTAKFGSGCSAIFAETVVENSKNGRRTFLGLFDPSARPYIEENILSFAIPMSRFEEMYQTMRESSLFDAHAWRKVRERITREAVPLT